MNPQNLTAVREVSDAPTIIFIILLMVMTYIFSLIEENRY